MLLVLCYHNIVQPQPGHMSCNDYYFLNLPRDIFSWQMEWVSRHFDIIPLDDLISGKPIPRRSAIVTFDDGFKSVYSEAFPLLKALGATATVFLTGAQIAENSPPWTSKLHHIVDSLVRQGLVIKTGRERYDFSTKKEAIRFLEKLKPSLVKEGFKKICATLSCLEALNGRSLPHDWVSREFLSTEELLELGEHGWTIGNHTFNHLNLGHLSRGEIEYEIGEAQKALQQFKQFRNVLALPFGGSDSFTREIIDVARRNGIRYVFTTMGRLNDLYAGDLVHRVICETFSLAYFKLLVNGKKEGLERLAARHGFGSGRARNGLWVEPSCEQALMTDRGPCSEELHREVGNRRV